MFSDGKNRIWSSIFKIQNGEFNLMDKSYKYTVDSPYKPASFHRISPQFSVHALASWRDRFPHAAVPLWRAYYARSAPPGLRSRRSPWCPMVHLKPFNDAGWRSKYT